MAANKTILTHNDVFSLAADVSTAIIRHYFGTIKAINIIKAYPIPRGGVPVGYLIAAASKGHIQIVENPDDADVFVDDIIDSGTTMDRYCTQWPDKLFFALIDKRVEYPFGGDWVVFPWERNEQAGNETIEDNIVRLLQYVGEDPKRGGLLETPKRVAKAWSEWTSGYKEDAATILKVFEDGAEEYDQMVTVKDIPFYSHCEHHMAPFFGTCTISYIPNGKIVGLSKLSRIVQMYARRLQVQERLTSQIAEALNTHLQPLGVGVSITARHMCMESRGVKHQGSGTVTTALKGEMKDNDQTRAEFLATVNGR